MRLTSVDELDDMIAAQQRRFRKGSMNVAKDFRIGLINSVDQ